MTRHRRPLLVTLGAASVLALAGCATPAGSAAPSSAGDAPVGASLGSLWPAPPEGDVIAQGTVMDVGGEAELCLGPIAESYPPQCSGIPIADWTWEGIDGSESSGDTTWGAYAVQGEYDGEQFTVSQPPVMLALYDPMMQEDPTGGKPGQGDEATLTEIQDELPDILQEAYLGSWVENGWLYIDVVWDDGTWQKAADDDYGDDTVIVRSAMRPVDG